MAAAAAAAVAAAAAAGKSHNRTAGIRREGGMGTAPLQHSEMEKVEGEAPLQGLGLLDQPLEAAAGRVPAAAGRRPAAAAAPQPLPLCAPRGVAATTSTCQPTIAQW